MCIKKAAVVAVSSVLAMLAVGCTQPIILKKSPSEIVMTSINSDSRAISYTFESKVADPFKFENFTFDVNPTYAANFRVYMNTKYASVGEGNDLKIDIVLESCELKVTNANSGAQNTANVFGALAGQGNQYNNILMTTEMKLAVKVEKDGEVSQKNIISSDEYNGTANNAETARKCFDQAIGKSIIMVDKFLASL